ncbi:competence protein CoiA [Streptomyces sp. NBC_00285]|uniref:competence protein CoiA family protein n=1 Tax=Streptomyces sp. NBC_00285 TaxID=2975700 RepID=UPI002E2B9B6C|nr:competence protein CoiA family protein [Streptomyces sp. NBC_00285]
MPSPYSDHRLVQTAVIGDKKSDLAIILPMEAAELARWRKQHPNYTYWCGILLGGCGEPLTDRLYHSKVCHFAHHPHRQCHRTANGEDSADHLFAKRAVHQWLDSQRLRGGVQLRSLGLGPGDAVDVDVRDTGRRLRFQLSPVEHADWRRIARELDRDAEDSVDWVFGMKGIPPHDLLDRDGYTFRIRFDTQGAARCPYIGTQRPSGEIEWAPFEDCWLTPEGLRTPAVEAILAERRPFASPSSEVRAQQPAAAKTRARSRGELVRDLRQALELDARWRTRPTWRRLAHTVNMDLAEYNSSELRDLLIDVDRRADKDEPVLSALLQVEDGDPLPYLGSITYSLGLGNPGSPPVIRRWRLREVERALAKYGVPARTMPERLSITALEHVPGYRALNEAADRKRQRESERGYREFSKVQQLADRGQQLLSRLERSKPRQRLQRQLTHAQRWLSGVEGWGGRQGESLSGADLAQARDIARSLNAVIASAEQSIAKRQSDKQREKREGHAKTPKPTAARPQAPAAITVAMQTEQLRQRLIKVARDRRTVTWEALTGGISDALDALPYSARWETLSRVDAESATAEPLLSALVTTPGGGPVPYYRQVLRKLGFEVPRTNEALRMIWEREQERAYVACGDSSTLLPPRLVPRAGNHGMGAGADQIEG